MTAFHLKNWRVNVKLNVSWNGIKLEHVDNLSTLAWLWIAHWHIKVIVWKLVRKFLHVTIYSVNLLVPTGVRMPKHSAQQPWLWCFSTAEYYCPVWERSTHKKKLDIALYETFRMVTGCIRSTPTSDLALLSGIASPHIRAER